VRVALVGGLGFVGSRVARDLEREGHEVVLVDAARDTGHPGLRVCDIRDADATLEALHDAEAVFHAAALGTHVERSDPARVLELNLRGTVNVLEAVRRGAAERVVFASSAVVYGAGNDGLLAEADVPPAASVYGASKLAGESLVRAYAAQFGLSGVSLRFMNIYGHKPPSYPWRDVVTATLDRLDAGERPIVAGGGTDQFDFVHVDDVSRAVVLALQSRAEGELNVGTGRATSVRELVELVLSVTGIDRRAEEAPGRGGPPRRLVADVSRAAAEIGFRAQIGLADGIADLLRERAAAAEQAEVA
jgi:UDP-glucose 4-epimerase